MRHLLRSTSHPAWPAAVVSMAMALAFLPRAAEGQTIPGDVNGDSQVNVQDVFYLINYLFAGGPAPVLPEITVNLPGDVPLVLVKIPVGTYQMGSPESERGRAADETRHEVTLTQDFYLGKTEVTQQQWAAVMGTPMSMSCGNYGVGDSYPVYCVSWHDIASGPDSFLAKLNTHLADTGQLGAGKFRLPTEAEWERAARAGTTTPFSFGDDAGCSITGCGGCALFGSYMWWCGNNTPGGSKPVGQKLPNSWGLHDMHGNVREWVQDWHGAYPTSSVVDPQGPPTGTHRVIRGGYWLGNPVTCRSADRYYTTPVTRFNYFGFRLARSV